MAHLPVTFYRLINQEGSQGYHEPCPFKEAKKYYHKDCQGAAEDEISQYGLLDGENYDSSDSNRDDEEPHVDAVHHDKHYKAHQHKSGGCSSAFAALELEIDRPHMTYDGYKTSCENPEYREAEALHQKIREPEGQHSLYHVKEGCEDACELSYLLKGVSGADILCS